MYMYLDLFISNLNSDYSNWLFMDINTSYSEYVTFVKPIPFKFICSMTITSMCNKVFVLYVCIFSIYSCFVRGLRVLAGLLTRKKQKTCRINTPVLYRHWQNYIVFCFLSLALTKLCCVLFSPTGIDKIKLCSVFSHWH